MPLGNMVIGVALEDMIQTDGWRYIEDWIKSREKLITTELKSQRFETLAEVKALQSELQAYSLLISEVKHRINQAKIERERTNRE